MRTRIVYVAAVGLMLASVLLPASAVADDDRPKSALALGAGVVNAGGEGEVYWNLGFRWRLGESEGDYDELYDEDDDANRRREERGEEDGALVGYIEPELGYWVRNDRFGEETDLLVGLNIIGVVPTPRVDYFLGAGAGVHLFDSQFRLPGRDENSNNFGVNVQFGVDLKLSDTLSAFGVGRIDLLEGAREDTQQKVFLGLRFRMH